MIEQSSPVPVAEITSPATEETEKKDKKNKKKKDKDKDKEKERGIETMYRVTYQNHIALSQLADNKANMLISINGLIISVMIAIVTRTGALAWSVVPVVVLIAGCMISLAFAVIAARPRLSRERVTLEQVRDGSRNLLFFGQFTTMPLAEFQASLKVLAKDPKLLRQHLGRQLYHMGESLNGKYRWLQRAYGAFLGGTGVATVLFLGLYATGRLGGIA